MNMFLAKANSLFIYLSSNIITRLSSHILDFSPTDLSVEISANSSLEKQKYGKFLELVFLGVIGAIVTVIVPVATGLGMRAVDV